VARRIAFCSLWVRVGGDRCGIDFSFVHWHDGACCGEVKASLLRVFPSAEKMTPNQPSVRHGEAALLIASFPELWFPARQDEVRQ